MVNMAVRHIYPQYVSEKVADKVETLGMQDALRVSFVNAYSGYITVRQYLYQKFPGKYKVAMRGNYTYIWRLK